MGRDTRTAVDTRDEVLTDIAGPALVSEAAVDAAAHPSKLSISMDHDLSERLRNLAFTHRLSESSIVEVALTMFFARGDDALLGVLLKQLGASRRRK